MKPEYLEFRCCMCPHTDRFKQSLGTCPPAPLHPNETPCRFVKTYQDNRGWQYFVRSGLGESNYKAFYRKPGKNGSHGYTRLPWRKSFDEAQSDLNKLAKKKGWLEVDTNA